MGAGSSAEVPGGGSEGYHVLRVNIFDEVPVFATSKKVFIWYFCVFLAILLYTVYRVDFDHRVNVDQRL